MTPGARPSSANAGESSFGYHRLATLSLCERRYAFRYGLRFEPHRTADAPALGSLLHIAAMHHYRAAAGLEAHDPVTAMREAPARIVHQYARALEIWPRYVEWARTEDNFRVLDVEREYEATIQDRRITSRLDLVVQVGAKVRVIDHKSTGGQLRYVASEYADSGQMCVEEALGEAVLPAMYGLEWGGLFITAISTSGAEPVALRSRVSVKREWRDAVLASLGPMLQHAADLEAQPGWGSMGSAFQRAVSAEACRDRWGKCPYFDLCREGPSARNSAAFPFDRAIGIDTTLREGTGR